MLKSSRGILAALVVLCFSCSPDRQSSDIHVLISSPVVSIDPHTTEDTQSLSVLANLYEPLVTFGNDMKILPRLATSWSNPRETVWRFVLRKEVHFHDGSPFTAYDVLYSINRVLHDKKSAVKPWLKLVRRAVVVDEYTIDLITEKPSPFLLSGLANVLMISKGNGSSVKTRVNGTGPYVLKSLDSSGNVVLERHETYWKEKPFWKRAYVNHHLDPAWRVQQVLDGKADFAVANESVLKAASAQGKIQVLEYPAAKVTFLGFSLRKMEGNIFVYPEIRKAVSLAMNQESLIRDTLGGLAQRATQPAPFEVFGYDPSIPLPRYDPESARQILGHFSDQLRTHPPLYFTSGSRLIAAFIKREMEGIGISFDLREMSPEKLDSFLFQQAAPAYIVQMTFPTMDATDVLIDAFHTKTEDRTMGSLNFSGYSNPELDQLLDASNSEMIPEKRYELLARAMRIVLDSNVWIPLCVRSNLFAATKNLRWNGNATGRILLEEIQPANVPD